MGTSTSTSTSVRLQVILGRGEMERYRRVACEAGMPLSSWVRMALGAAARDEPGGNRSRKMDALDAACCHSFPVPPEIGPGAAREQGRACDDHGGL